MGDDLDLYVKDGLGIPRLHLQNLINLINQEFVDVYVLFTPDGEMKVFSKESDIPGNPIMRAQIKD